MSPGLFLHTGNRLELLADHLACLIRDNPLPPFVPERVVVQSFGMRRWLQFQLASRLGICADLQCPFARGYFQELLRGGVDPEAVSVSREEREPVLPWPEPEHLLWRIMGVLQENLDESRLAPLTRYYTQPAAEAFAEGSQRQINQARLYQVSRNLAELFDQYFIYRPRMLRGWDAGQQLEPEDAWQAHLWRLVFQDRPWLHPAALQKQFLEKAWGDALPAEHLPPRVVLFGISSLPPFYLDLLEGLARHCPVHLYAFQPCEEFWADLKGRKQQAREQERRLQAGTADANENADADAHGSDQVARASWEIEDPGHPLLSALGRQGRAFQGLLIDLEEARTTEHFAGDRGSLLRHLQCDLLELKNRGAPHPDAPAPVEIGPEDDTLRFHPCHSPLREMQVLRNVLLDAFEKDAGLEPQDVVVMFPDVEAYAPYIEAVFDSPEQPDPGDTTVAGRGAQSQRIPFTIADRSARASGGVIQAFLKLLELPRHRFALSEILDLLGLEIIQTAHDWTAEDLEMLRQMIDQAQIRWGLDHDYRASLQLPGTKPNTWRAGLDGLMLGWVLGAEESPALPDLSPVTPLPGDAWGLLARFDQFLQNLSETEKILRSPKPVEDWAPALRTLVDQFFGHLRDPAASGETQVILDALQHLRDTARAADFTEPVPGEVFISQLSRHLQQERSAGGFLSGGVTFCALKPLRSIPFKMVWLAGLNDGAFPRTTRRPSYDLISRDPRPGDRSSLDEERYLFLEALLSVRDRLGLSYVGYSVADNSAQPPSVLVRELRDYLDQAYRAPGGQGIVGQITARHMLHPFHPGYFSASRDAEPGQFSYSRFDARVAQILRDQEETRQPRPFFTQLLPPLREPDESSQPVELTLRDLITFFRNPCRYFLRHRLRTDPPLEHDQVNDTELFTVNGLQRFQLLQLLLDEQLGGGDPRACYPALLNRGLLPHGEPGRIAFLDLCGDLASFGEMLQPLLQPGSGESPEPVLDFEGHDPRFHLTGVLPPVRARGPVHFRPSSLKTGLWMEAWITHLAHNYAAPDLPAEQRQSWLAGYDDKKPSLYRLEPLPPDDAAARLTELARIALSADRRPPRFFPRASWAYAHKLTHPKTAEEPEAAAMREARKVFHPRKFPDRGQPGDLEDPAIAAFYDNTTNRPQNRPDPATPDQVPVPHVDLGDPLDQSFRSLSETIFLPLLKTSSKVGD